MLRFFAPEIPIGSHDVCIVGAGPVGIAVALACEEHGISVLLLESGQTHLDEFAASLTAGHSVDQSRHAVPSIAICRALGGTSRWWGGRCVPFDNIDFATRDHAREAAWPISHDEISPWYSAAATFFGIGRAIFHAGDEAWSGLEGASFDQLERWTPVANAASLHRERLEKSSLITVVLGVTVTKLDFSEDGNTVSCLTIGNASKTVKIAARRIVFACGGLETTRLLLATQKSRPEAFGGPNGALGRYYMGHISGKIADIVLANPSLAAAQDFFVDDDVYMRRRFTLPAEVQSRDSLLNIAFWPDNPPFYKSDHRNGVLSLVWTALALRPLGRLLASEGVRVSHVGPKPSQWCGHLRNILSSPFVTVREIFEILFKRYMLSPRKPGFLVRNSGGRYALHYHSEQLPDRASSVRLSDRVDALGLPFLDIVLTHDVANARSIVRAHDLLDQALRRSGLGRLDYYHATEEARIESILRQAKDGFHQIGTTRMGVDRKDSVVDADCRTHGVDNLYIASSSVFCSSGQANPTFFTVAMALRLADHLANCNREPASQHTPSSRSISDRTGTPA